MKENKGVTFIELMIVISVIGIMIVVTGFSFQSWTANYRIESQIKEMYADLMNTRVSAISRNKMYFVTLTANQYSIYEDTNPQPDGNNALETTLDTQIIQKSTNYPVVFALSLGHTKFNIDRQGMLSNNGTIRFDSNAAPDYDCIVLFSTRINIGKWNGAKCNAK
jgi:prepilin-type N-terminal cleavage/methylation domain-containing protein